MNAQQMRRLKTLLEIRQHELRLSIEHHQKYARQVEPESDTVDQAASGSEKASLLQRSSREQQLLRAIDSALGRIRDGTFLDPDNGFTIVWGKQFCYPTFVPYRAACRWQTVASHCVRCEFRSLT
jgi:hypothetical protein